MKRSVSFEGLNWGGQWIFLIDFLPLIYLATDNLFAGICEELTFVSVIRKQKSHSCHRDICDTCKFEKQPLSVVSFEAVFLTLARILGN